MPISEKFYELKPNLIFSIATPLFVLLFVVLYRPTFGMSDVWILKWYDRLEFYQPIVCAIELVALLCSRAILCFTLVRHNLSKIEFLVWQLVEFIIICLFVDLFVSLVLQLSYFELLPRIMLIVFAFNIFPYAIYTIIVEAFDLDSRLSESEKTVDDLRKGLAKNETGMVRFVDDKGNTKIMIGADRIISIESAGNYVTILYDDGGKLVRYSLRNTLKGVEDVCAANGLVRCHRSYFVNLSKVKIIRRTPDGVFAEIEHQGVDNIPVSKSYASELIRLFSEG